MKKPGYDSKVTRPFSLILLLFFALKSSRTYDWQVDVAEALVLKKLYLERRRCFFTTQSTSRVLLVKTHRCL
jgi:hypothetical protein